MGLNDLPKWKTTASKYIVNDRWLKLRADTCVTPDGETLDPWYVAEKPEWVNCLAIDSNNNVALLHHYRHGVDEYIQEIIGGTVETGDSPMETIERELYEEIGYKGGRIYQTGVSYANPDIQNNKAYSFLAVGGTFSQSTYKEIGADFTIEKINFKDFVEAVTNPSSTTTYQSLHLTAVFFALNFIRCSHDKDLLSLRKQLDI